MKTKNIFKTLAFVILMPAMLLTTACGKETVNDENTHGKGFALPVTVNVSREGDDATKATYNESTRKLEFSAGDKLFVSGNYDDWYKSFAGTLDYDAESKKFKGTIYTEDDTYKTYEDLFGNSDYTIATLLPAGYKDHGYLVINTNDPDAQYDDFVAVSSEYTLATSKADGVAQFSYEYSYNYNNGFALSPVNAILNFTITGLAASTSVNVSLTSMAYNITGTVTTDASGNATFAAGIMAGLNLQPFSLTVGGKNITIVSSDKVVEEGKIYNITRAAAPAPDPLTIEAITAGTIVVKSPQNGMQYSLDGGATKVSMTGYTDTYIAVEAGQKVRFYGNGTSITAYGNGHDTSFGGSGDGFTCKVYGNIMSLLDETGYATATTLSSNYVFWALFSGNTALTDASGLLLPATTLTQYCYQVMFSGCSSLTAAPELPATTLVQGCYQRMFKGCASLTSVKCLATSGIDTNMSTYNWLDGVSATGTFTKAASATTWPTSSSGIPSGWTVVNAE